MHRNVHFCSKESKWMKLCVVIFQNEPSHTTCVNNFRIHAMNMILVPLNSSRCSASRNVQYVRCKTENSAFSLHLYGIPL